MFSTLTWMAIAGAIVARLSAAICYKISSQQQQLKRIVGFFLLGLCFGFFNPVCVAIAMRGNHPNVIIATIGGIGGAVFVLVINRVFKERLTRWQWAAIGIIFVGAILLQLGSSRESVSAERTVPAASIQDVNR